ncbi:non-POU domain-containing octamer-binding protein-like [Hydractinia symbiolongicarpus]|uniref:non-POU domain-containing octamer-binding protein-like n=1 Tax=Hydractinia symbiolongicarpus TaxID=13093 RepID=UPI00254C8ACB|nr:non-POU domain-containing octamer-binding protein-like [Hydractinia symbiolongicarpus]
MFRGRGGNRRSFDPNFRQGGGSPYGGNKKDFNNSPNRKTEWVSYKKQSSSADKASVSEEKTNFEVPFVQKIDTGVKSEETQPLLTPKVEANAVVVTPQKKVEKDRSRSPIVDKKDQSNKFTHRDSLSDKQKVNESPKQTNDFKSSKSLIKQGEKKFSGRCRLFVANMNNGTTEEDLRELFGEYGEIGEVYVNKEKGFGFIRLDYRHNAEMAKSCLDKKLFKGRNIQVRYATHASAVEVHGLDQYASNEYIEQAMSQFGTVERAVVVCDDRGRSKGYAIVEFEWKKSAQKVLDRFKEEMFVLGRLPKPIFVKPRSQLDEEEGLHDSTIERLPGFQSEREFQPRFISPSSFEYTWAKRWRDLFIEEEDKKARLEQELQESRYRLELEMESAQKEQEAVKIREELIRRQEELRMLEEDMRRRQEANLRTREELDRNRAKRFEEQRHPNHISNRQEAQGGGNYIVNDNAAQHDFMMNQQAELEARRGDMLMAAGGVQTSVLGIRPDMIRPPGVHIAGLQLPPHMVANIPPGFLPGQRGPPPGVNMGFMPGRPPPRHFAPRGGHGDHHFDHKRPRRN